MKIFLLLYCRHDRHCACESKSSVSFVAMALKTAFHTKCVSVLSLTTSIQTFSFWKKRFNRWHFLLLWIWYFSPKFLFKPSILRTCSGNRLRAFTEQHWKIILPGWIQKYICWLIWIFCNLRGEDQRGFTYDEAAGVHGGHEIEDQGQQGKSTADTPPSH